MRVSHWVDFQTEGQVIKDRFFTSPTIIALIWISKLVQLYNNYIRAVESGKGGVFIVAFKVKLKEWDDEMDQHYDNILFKRCLDIVETLIIDNGIIKWK